jgi:hypothetical protein
MLRLVTLVRIDVSEECIASIIKVTRIGRLGTTLAVTSNQSKRRIKKRFQLADTCHHEDGGDTFLRNFG